MLKVTSDRGQIFIGMAMPDGEWRDKEDILTDQGILRTRYDTVDGLWEGYDPDIQAADLQTHIPLLVAASSGAA